METKPAVDVVILTPGHSVTSDYVKSLFRTIEVMEAAKMTWAWSSEYSSHVADAREITLSGSRINNPLENRPLSGQLDYKKLMWIDSDISWNPEDFMRLYESDKDIATGAYLLADGSTSIFKEFLGKMYTQEEIKELKEEVEITSCGFGFICIKPGIFEAMARPWFQQVPVTLELNGQVVSFPIMGEDVSWCVRASRLGYKIWLDPKVLVSHKKMITLDWSLPNGQS